MKFRQKVENLVELLTITIADETDEFVAEDLAEQITSLAEEAIQMHNSSSEDYEDTSEDVLDFHSDMDIFSEDDS